MARRKGRHHRARFTLPLAVIGGFVPLGVAVGQSLAAGSPAQAADEVVKGLTGWSPTEHRWNFTYLKNGAAPIALGFLVHWIASRVGINRALGRARVPLIRI